MLAPSEYPVTGFKHLRGHFSNLRSADLEQQIAALFIMQAQKIKDYRPAHFPQLLGEMEATDKEALYQVQKLIPSSHALWRRHRAG